MELALAMVCLCSAEPSLSLHNCVWLLVLSKENVMYGCTTISGSKTSSFCWVYLAKVQLQLHHKRKSRFHRIRWDRCNFLKALLPHSMSDVLSKRLVGMDAIAEAIDAFLTPGEHTLTVRYLNRTRAILGHARLELERHSW
jgi:hypothetical protein